MCVHTIKELKILKQKKKGKKSLMDLVTQRSLKQLQENGNDSRVAKIG